MSCCVMPLDHGDWTASLVDRQTEAELPLERYGWRASAGRRRGEVSEATLIMDPDYARRFDRRPELWNTELALHRDGRLEWIGPIVEIDDTVDGVVWRARDRMAFVIDRRAFWRDGNYAGDTANLMNLALDAADVGDPTGLRRELIPTGVVAAMPVTAGDKIGPALQTLAVPWTVVADTIRFGDIDRDSQVLLPADAWGEDQPGITADGFERLTHVVAVTENNGRVFYPSADPLDRPAGSPLLIDTIDVGDISNGAALALARQAWLARQGELTIVATDTLPLTDRFPLPWTALEPGVLMYSSARGSELTITITDIPVRVSTLNVDIADGQETSVLVEVTEADNDLWGLDPRLNEIGSGRGTSFGELDPYPLGRAAAGIGSILDGDADLIGTGDFEGIDWSNLDDYEGIDLGDSEGIDWDDLGLVADGDFDIGGLSGPDPAFDPIDLTDTDSISPLGAQGVDLPLIDQYADCPPAHCCDLCGGTGGSDGPGKIWVATSLSLGDTTWVAKDGDTRDLASPASLRVSDGGIAQGPYTSPAYLISPQTEADITGTVTWDIEMTTWWTTPDGWRNNMQPLIYDWNQTWFIAPTAWSNESDADPKPASMSVLDYRADPDLMEIPIDPSSVGLTGWGRGRVRIQYNATTGACSVWLANSDTAGGIGDLSFVLQGSDTFDTGGSDTGSALEFQSFGYAFGLTNHPTREGPTVIHDVLAYASELGGYFLNFEEWDLVNNRIEYEPGVRVSAPFNFGNCILDHGVSWQATSRAMWSPQGLPIYVFEDYSDGPGTVRADIWNGPRLSSPMIAASTADDPHTIYLYAVDPLDWHDYVVANFPDLYGTYIWAIIDRDFLNVPLDDNQWALDWWPFGSQHR